jgi:hypothetical protein
VPVLSRDTGVGTNLKMVATPALLFASHHGMTSTPSHGPKWVRPNEIASQAPPAPSFSPYRSPFRRCAHSPFRLNLERYGGVVRLVERVAVPAVFELVEDSAGQFGGLYS